MRSAQCRFLCIFALLLACSNPTAPDPTGVWGGPDASLVLSRTGGTLSYPCGAGTIDSTWTLSRDGQFTGTGQHFFGGGPEPIEGRPPHPALYAGHIDRNTLVLTVTLTDLGQTMGPFRLLRGGPLVQEQCV